MIPLQAKIGIISLTSIILFIIIGMPFITQIQGIHSRTFVTDSYNMTGSKDPSINETMSGVPADVFNPMMIVVHKGDLVKIHFTNVDPTDYHTFTMGAPYNINVVIQKGTSEDFSFYADYVGTFKYVCVVHQPTMIGYLVVLN